MKKKGEDNDDSGVVKAPNTKIFVNSKKTHFFQQPKPKYKLQRRRLHDLPAGPT